MKNSNERLTPEREAEIRFWASKTDWKTHLVTSGPVLTAECAMELFAELDRLRIDLADEQTKVGLLKDLVEIKQTTIDQLIALRRVSL